jgi:hypothetical protein
VRFAAAGSEIERLLRDCRFCRPRH